MWLWANDITTAWRGVPNGTLSMIFTCCPNLMFLSSPWLEIQRFQIGHFADFEQFKADIHFATRRQVKTVPICSFLLTGDSSQLLYSVWVRHREKQSKPSLFDKNSRTTRKIWHKLFSMIQSAAIKNWLPQSINRLYMLSLLFLSVTRFLWFLR